MDSARGRTRSREDREAALKDWMSEWALERADSEWDVEDVVREREADRDVVPEREREPLDLRPAILRTSDVRDARGLAPVDKRPTLSLRSASSLEPSASGTDISDSS